MEITINEKKVNLKYSFRAMMIYENITNKSFNPKGISDVVVFFYSVVLASTKDTSYSFDSFIDWLDDNPGAINDFSMWLTEVFTAQAALVNKNVQVDTTSVEEKN